MKLDIILAGVGGQGILTIASIIGNAALQLGLNLKQAEVHGMSQRGGDVQSNLRLSQNHIYSDLIPQGQADLIISLEPMEALRYTPWLNPHTGITVTSTVAVKNITHYPPTDSLIAELRSHSHRCIALDIDEIARQASAQRSANIALLGAASHHIEPLIPATTLEDAICQIFSSKDQTVINSNLAAFRLARQASQNN